MFFFALTLVLEGEEGKARFFPGRETERWHGDGSLQVNSVLGIMYSFTLEADRGLFQCFIFQAIFRHKNPLFSRAPRAQNKINK